MNKDLHKKLIRFSSKAIQDNNAQLSFIEGVNRAIDRWYIDSQLNRQLKYSDLNLDQLTSIFKNSKNLLSAHPEQSLLTMFRNTSNDLRSILHKQSYSHDVDESTIEVIPQYKKHLYDALLPLTIELQSHPHDILQLLFQLLHDSLEQNIELSELKGKNLDSELLKELVYNIASEFVQCGGKISCGETSLFTEIIYDVFSYVTPDKNNRSIKDFLKDTCGGTKIIKQKIEPNVTRSKRL